MTLFLAGLGGLSLLGVVAQPALAQSCPTPPDLTCQFLACRSPAFGVPSALWGELKPVDEGQLPIERDNTDFNPIVGPYSHTEPRWMAVDIEGSTLFAGINFGLQVWDIGGANAGNPSLTSVTGTSSFPYFSPGFSEEKNPVRDLDAPPGNDNVLAVALVKDSGLSVFDTSNKGNPFGIYADQDRNALQVYSSRIGNTDYAFLATRNKGVTAYNLTTAANLAVRCVDDSPTSTSCGPYLGRMGTRNDTSYIDGTGNFVVLSSGLFDHGVEIWNVANPANPIRVLDVLGTDFVQGVALWKKGNSYYLGVVISCTNNGTCTNGIDFRIYNMSCLSSGSCGSLGAQLFRKNLPAGGTEFFLTYSKSASRDFLSLGTVNLCSQLTQNEWLYDVSTPSAAFDITPSDGLVSGQSTGYWGWYYRRNLTGFNNTAGRMGKLSGQYFYRAAFNIFDIHELTSGVVPNASFSFAPNPVYQGEQIDFADTSTGSPSSWSWTFQDASPATSANQNPQNVVFNSTGSKTVGLTASNINGPSTTTQLIPVLNPAPAVASVSAAPNPALLCQPVTFSAQGVTGLPPRTLSWIVRDNQGATVGTGGDENPFVWDTEAAVAPVGTYTAEVTVSNSVSTASATSPVLTLNPLPALSFTSPGGAPETLNGPPFGSGTVNFRIQSTGATEWRWDFGDGTTPVWTNNPTTGPAPNHTYASTGTYFVSVEIQNCQQAAITSSATSVQITDVTPLIADFQAISICAFGPCAAVVGQPISFLDTSQGTPDFFDYDWDGNGTFEDSGNTSPVVTHTYLSQGTFSPALKVRRGTDSDTFVHDPILVATGGGGGGNPSVAVGGPSSAQVDTTINFSATANNCTPSPTVWSWNVGSGGTITGSSTGSSISVTYSTTGTKTVTATAQSGGCIGTSGSKTVVISDAPGGGGTLTANFVFSPTSPNAGQSITFNSTSVGSPNSLDWKFGDGATANGTSVTHTYSSAGTYTVTLDASRFPDPSCPPFELCVDTETKQVVVGGGGGGGGGGGSFNANFTVSVPCVPFNGGLELCEADAGQPVTLTATSQLATSHNWIFGDGTNGSGPRVIHSWNTPGQYVVVLQVQDGEGGATSLVKVFEIVQGSTPVSGEVIIPWITDTTGAVNQDSDLYVTNPSEVEMTVDITFRKRGLPEPEPPFSTHTIPAGGTLLVPDALETLYGRDNSGGFLVVDSKSGIPPVAVSLNRTRQPDGTQYGQMVPGLSQAELNKVAGTVDGRQYLLGLNDTADRLTSIGLTNPHPQPATYRLRFFDTSGNPLGIPSDVRTLSSWGQKQYQVQEIRQTFGFSGEADYRVEIEQLSGDTLFAFAGLIRQGTQDPSFVRVSVPNLDKIYLFGVANKPGANSAQFGTDILLSNPMDAPMDLSVSYLNVGVGATPEATVSSTLQPNETLRVNNILDSVWGVEGVGVLIFESTGAGGLYPMIHGETFQDGGLDSRYGLFMPARRDSEVAHAGQSVFLSGLRQLDNDSNTTLWLFNPEGSPGSYSIIYRALDGSELGRTPLYSVGPGAIRQINPGALKLPVGGVEGGFSVEVKVNAGSLLLAAQVVINQTNDPAFVAGVVR